MFKNFQETLTFDDVLLVPQESGVLPKDTALTTYLTPELRLNTPFLSAPMDTVTEHKMAVALALAGGLGVIHKNLSVEQQVKEVELVKRFENGFIEDPVTVAPEDKISKVIKLTRELGFEKFPVVDKRGKLVGIISDADYFASEDARLLVKFRLRPLKEMTVARAGTTLLQANTMLKKHRLRTLCVVDAGGKLVSIVTRRDVEKNDLYPLATKNARKQLRAGAAVGVGQSGLERAEGLVAAGADLIVVDTAHGHSRGVLETIRELRKKFKDQPLAAGNIATAEGALALAEAGADIIKVGIGPGSICTTRVVAGVGVPQLSAVLAVAEALKKFKKRRATLIADGGLKHSGDIVKALAAGAHAVMMGNMFAGTDQAPGRVEYVGGRMYKVYRGMGSLEAMEIGSRDRYGQGSVTERNKLVPEGVSGKVPYKGPVERIIYQLTGGVKSGLGYMGAKNLSELVQRAVFVKITGASLAESHPHDLAVINAAPNYGVGE